MLKAVIFDMDGVLIDSEPIHMKAFEILFEQLGLSYEKEYYLQFIGSTTDHMWDTVIKDYGVSMTKDQLMEMCDKNVAKIIGETGYPVIEGVSGLIRSLHEAGILLAVASSSGKTRIENTLSKMHIISCFDVVVSGTEVAHPKPAPDTFLKAAEKLEVEPSECMVVEDSLNGMQAAKQAGMVCVMYEGDNDLPRPDASYADYVIQGFEETDASYFKMIYAHTGGEP